MKYKICHIILFLATVGMALSISVAEASEEPVIIGVPLPLSGNLQEFGMMMKNSFEVASDALKRTTSFRENGIEFAHCNVTVYMPPEATGAGNGKIDKKVAEAAGAAAVAVAAEEAKEEQKKSK